MLHRDFGEFLKLLNDLKVKDLIAGGCALNFYISKPCNNGDIDRYNLSKNIFISKHQNCNSSKNNFSR